jgi:hypothetical protein
MCVVKRFSWLTAAVYAACLTVSGTAVEAATLKINSGAGDVLVNSGNGFRKVGGTSQVKTGDQIMVRTKGSAVVVYDNGCNITVNVGLVQTVVPEGLCSLGITDGTPVGPNGGPVTTTLVPPTAGEVLIGAAVIGGGVVAIVAATRDDGASP